MTPLEHAVVLLHFQSTRAHAAIATLPAHEQAMIARVDRRAFAADSERRARAASVLVEELPIATAVVGAAALFAFFDDAAFESVLAGHEGLVPAAARWLEPRAGDFAVLEGAIARARRRHGVALAAGSVTLAPGVWLCEVGEGALEAYGRERAALGDAPHERVARGARVAALSAMSARAHVLVQGGTLSHLSAALFHVLRAAEAPAPRGVVENAARAQGADDDEARALIDELITDALLVRG